MNSLLDANPDVRKTLSEILPGDVIAAPLQHITAADDRKRIAFKAYPEFLYKRDSNALTDEAGDDSGLPLAKSTQTRTRLSPASRWPCETGYASAAAEADACTDAD